MENRGYRILLVEDDIIDQMAFKKMVRNKELNYDYLVAGSAKEAAAAVENNSFDLVITDYLLGDGTAFDVMKMLKETPVIITTGAGNEEVAVRAMHEGANDYLVKDSDGNYLKVLPITIENVIERVMNQKQLKILSHALMSIGDSVFITDTKDNILNVNKAFVDTFGYQPEEVIGKNCCILSKVCEKIKDGCCDWEDSLDSMGMNEVYHLKKDGSEFPALLSNSCIKDDNGNVLAKVGVVRDITEIKEAQKKLQVYATMDILTGALNRRAGLVILEKQIQLCKRNNWDLTICYIDVDGLKDVNDTYGHQEGDDYILFVTNVLKEIIRESDGLCRLGGDEFLLMLPECDVPKADMVLKRIVKSLDEHNVRNSKPYKISFSYGLVKYDFVEQPKIGRLIAKADMEMYKHKNKKKKQ
ncbi:MAG: response regulator receiver modulated diguanylate cyclase with sensor [Clostridia bacterium]|jgi:diguanylate cyclase (GGDEF)-like protein/PAS domain S-box-containing protein|nr:response regulator receiver modulated diguanylate cyclase with sensor [Clostridia bacterium]